MSSFTVTVLGQSIAVDCDPETVPPRGVADLRTLWASCLTDCEPDLRVWVAIGDRTEIPENRRFFVRGDDLRVVAHRLSDVIIGTAMSALVPTDAVAGRLRRCPDVIGIHAAAVARDGRAVLVVGGTRRSEVMTALGTAGFTLLSDAAVAVDLAAGTVTGAAKPLTTYPAPEILSRREVSLADAGLSSTVESLPLAAIAFLDSDSAEAPGWEVLPIPTAVARLAPAVPVFSALPQPVQDLARLLGLVGGAVSVRHSETAQLPDLLDELLATEVETELVIPIEPRPGADTTPVPGDVRRNTMVDGVSDGSVMALCTSDAKAVAVGGIAPHLWDAAREWIGIDALTDHVVAAVGVPEQADPRSMVERAVADLVQERVLVRLV